ncbi:MAG: response regulator [Rhodothermales bacterium]
MKHILIVDDKEDNLYMLQALLQGSGYEVVTAVHGAEALVKARKRPPDLVISDLLMPVMDGYTLLRRWKRDEALKEIPFVVYTATYTEDSDRKLALEMGADAFLLKPTEPEEFIRIIGEVASQSGVQEPGTGDPVGEGALFKVYSESLIRKLEEKSLELEEANAALQADLEVRRAVEASLRESEQRFRQLAEYIEEVFWISDPDKGTMHYISPAYETIWGRSCASLYKEPRNWIDALHPDDRDRVIRASNTKQVTGEYDETYRILRPDGSIRWIRDRAFPISNERGVVYRVVGTATDITEQREAELRIAEQAALLDKAHDAILVRDLDHRVLYWNKSAETLYGWTAEEATGRPVGDLIYADPAAFHEATQATLATGEWSGEIEQVTRSGTRLTINARWTLVRDDDGVPRSILSINMDVTDRKKLEQQFLRAQRMESIGTLAGGIAHDLNNLLAPIVMGVDLLRQVDLPPRLKAVVENIGKSAQRGTSLVKQVLSFARGVEGARVTLLMDHIVREVESIVATSFPKSIHFVRETDRELWPIVGDPTQLNQVVLNLCVNARDAMPEGGTIEVTTRNVIIDDQYAVMNPEIEAGKYVVVEVSDEGTGMSEDVINRLWEPFFTTKEVGEGTGLGLPTALSIVKSHGGTITVYSEVGRGSVFKVYLPAAEDTEAGLVTEAGDEEFMRGSGELILLVDDEVSILSITRHTLETFGYRVITADDGAQAVGVYADHRSEIDLVLTDMMMPVMDGSALIKALRRMDPEVRIVAASGIHGNQEVLGNGGAHVSWFLEKPYSASELLQTVARALRTG